MLDIYIYIQSGNDFNFLCISQKENKHDKHLKISVTTTNLQRMLCNVSFRIYMYAQYTGEPNRDVIVIELRCNK